MNIHVDPKAYFHCAECNELQSRERDNNELMRFCIDCSQIVCDKCTAKHNEPHMMISPEELSGRLEDAYKSFMPHLFPENSKQNKL